jgi:carbamoyl-phosphate synthase large subunit
VVVRPSYVLGGGHGDRVRRDVHRFLRAKALEAATDKPILIDHFLEDAIEVEWIGATGRLVVAGIMEHRGGGHPLGTRPACCRTTAPRDQIDLINSTPVSWADLKVKGLMNVQYAIRIDW